MPHLLQTNFYYLSKLKIEVHQNLLGVHNKPVDPVKIPVIEAGWFEIEVGLEARSPVADHLHWPILLDPQFPHYHVMHATIDVAPSVGFSPPGHIKDNKLSLTIRPTCRKLSDVVLN
jgi:hypothetical protein